MLVFLSSCSAVQSCFAYFHNMIFFVPFLHHWLYCWQLSGGLPSHQKRLQAARYPHGNQEQEYGRSAESEETHNYCQPNRGFFVPSLATPCNWCEPNVSKLAVRSSIHVIKRKSSSCDLDRPHMFVVLQSRGERTHWDILTYSISVVVEVNFFPDLCTNVLASW